jgi:hypothetical protein
MLCPLVLALPLFDVRQILRPVDVSQHGQSLNWTRGPNT